MTAGTSDQLESRPATGRRQKRFWLVITLVVLMLGLTVLFRPSRDPRFVGQWRHDATQNWSTLRSDGTLEYFTGRVVMDAGTENYVWWTAGDELFVRFRPSDTAFGRLMDDVRYATRRVLGQPGPMTSKWRIVEISRSQMVLQYPNGKRTTRTRFE